MSKNKKAVLKSKKTIILILNYIYIYEYIYRLDKTSSAKLQLPKMRKKRKVIDPVEEEILIQLKQSGQQSTSEINDEDLSFGQMILKG